jgi:hypothetical protein
VEQSATVTLLDSLFRFNELIFVSMNGFFKLLDNVHRFDAMCISVELRDGEFLIIIDNVGGEH